MSKEIDSIEGLPLDHQSFISMSKDKDKLFIVCMTGCPGIRSFIMSLEYSHFPPGTPMNDLFQYYLSKWEEMQWEIVQVPIKYKDLVWKVAEENRMRIVDGVPQLIGGGEQKPFPLTGDNVFTVENERNSKVYEGRTASQEVMKEDIKRAKSIMDAHMSALGLMCSKCGCFHDDTYAEKHPDVVKQLREICKTFDPEQPCLLCGYPVERLSMGGPEICCWCDIGQDPKVPPDERHAYYRKIQSR